MDWSSELTVLLCSLCLSMAMGMVKHLKGLKVTSCYNVLLNSIIVMGCIHKQSHQVLIKCLFGILFLCFWTKEVTEEYISLDVMKLNYTGIRTSFLWSWIEHCITGYTNYW